MHPEKHEVQEIYQLWKTYFGFDDGGSIDDYFKRNFTLETCYVLRKEQTIAAVLCAHPHTMMLHGKEVIIRFISGVITKEEFRHRGFMKELFHMVFADDPNCGLWVLQAYQPTIYASLGFYPTYMSNVYQLTTCPSPNTAHIADVNDASLLAAFAAVYLTGYDGYIRHDEAWYENILLEIKARKGKLLGCYDGSVLSAYAIVFQDANVSYIEEIMSMTLEAQNALFAHLLTTSKQIEVSTYAELPYPKQKETCSLLVRMGNVQTLENIFQTTITCLEDVYNHTKPYYHYGFW